MFKTTVIWMNVTLASKFSIFLGDHPNVDRMQKIARIRT